MSKKDKKIKKLEAKVAELEEQNKRWENWAKYLYDLLVLELAYKDNEPRITLLDDQLQYIEKVNK